MFKPGTRLSRGFLPRHYNYAALNNDPAGMEKLLIKYGHADPLNKIDPKKKQKIEILDEEGNVIRVEEGYPEGQPTIDMEAYGKDFLADAKASLKELPLGFNRSAYVFSAIVPLSLKYTFYCLSNCTKWILAG